MHRKTISLWLRPNTIEENFIKPLNKAIKTATVAEKAWKQELYKFLRNYRSSPLVTTGVRPARVSFNRHITTLTPEVSKSLNFAHNRVSNFFRGGSFPLELPVLIKKYLFST